LFRGTTLISYFIVLTRQTFNLRSFRPSVETLGSELQPKRFMRLSAMAALSVSHLQRTLFVIEV